MSLDADQNVCRAITRMRAVLENPESLTSLAGEWPYVDLCLPIDAMLTVA